ncbi:MAG: glycosyltransferase family 2 protein [Nitrospinae bacterium]|nr:glycosyltransferase family 2 protein [Nitrospinota bacterium]
MMETRKEHEFPGNTPGKGQSSFSQDLEEKETDPSISVVILAYRSGEGIHNFVESMVRSLDKNVPNWEIILVGNHFVDDGDPTPCIVTEIAQSHPGIRSVTRIKKGMMGWDMKSGLEAATGKTIAVIDGDGQMPFEDVVHVYKKLKDEGLDLVKTFRTKRCDGLYRKTISVVYNFIFNVLFPGLNCRDVNSKPKIMTREVYNRMCLSSNGWFIDAEIMILARKMKLKIGEIPTVFLPLNYRPSFVKLRSIWEFSVNLIWYRLFNRPRI